MKNLKKVIAVLLAVLTVCLSFVACSNSKTADTTADTTATTESDFDYITKKGKLVVGITEYPPMDYKESGSDEWVGFDADLGKAVAEKMGVDIEFVEISWDNKFIELNAKSIDCIWNGMTITDEVTKASSCTKAYAKNEQVVVMKKDKAASYKDIASLKDLSFAVESGSAGQSVAEDNGLNFTAVNAQSDTMLEVKSGSVDAAIIDSTMAGALTAAGSAYEDYAVAVVLNNEEYGISFRKGSDMTEKMNTYLEGFKADGTLKKLSEKYNVQLAD